MSYEILTRTFKNLKVLKLTRTEKNNVKYYECLCICGKKFEVRGGYLRRYIVTSCGCMPEAKGRSYTQTYFTWVSIKAKNKKLLCNKWNSFDEFFADMGENPGPGFRLLRKDQNKDFSKENCEWGFRNVQSKRLEQSVNININGEQLSLVEVAKKLGGHSGFAITLRLRRGWSLEKAISTPFEKIERHEFRGKLRSCREIAKLLKTSHTTIRYRIKHGIPIEGVKKITAPISVGFDGDLF